MVLPVLVRTLLASSTQGSIIDQYVACAILISTQLKQGRLMSLGLLQTRHCNPAFGAKTPALSITPNAFFSSALVLRNRIKRNCGSLAFVPVCKTQEESEPERFKSLLSGFIKAFRMCFLICAKESWETSGFGLPKNCSHWLFGVASCCYSSWLLQ